MPRQLEKPDDILGRKFGFLTVVEFVKAHTFRTPGRPRRDYIYRCRCECGEDQVVTKRRHLMTGHKTSCGCKWKPKAASSVLWTGFGEISGVLWSKIRNHARYRGLLFEITIEDAWARFLAQERRCALTGMSLVFGPDTSGENTGERTASLDRIDSRVGYKTTNIQWVHKDINQMKMDLKEDRFVELCQAVVNFRSRS